jgi:hypothetical protein
MGTSVVFFIVVLVVFIGLSLTFVESMMARIILWGIVGVSFLLFGYLAMIPAAILSIGIIIKSKMPKISSI